MGMFFTLGGSGAGCVRSWWTMKVNVRIRGLNFKGIICARWQSTDTKCSAVISSPKNCVGITSNTRIRYQIVDKSIGVSVSIALLTVNTIPSDSDISDIHRTGRERLH